jgi:hypothetical protein
MLRQEIEHSNRQVLNDIRTAWGITAVLGDTGIYLDAW